MDQPSLLTLQFKRLPFDGVKGIYKVNGQPDRMPDRLRSLAPDVAEAYLKDLSPIVTVSDMLRTAEQSLQAVQAKRGAQPPGFSGHNYGLSIDVDIKAVLKALSLKTKPQLDAWMRTRGWFCHRVDGLMEAEAWHYNYLGVGFVISSRVTSTNSALQAEIAKRYPMIVGIGVNSRTVQASLAKLGLYHGEVDGVIGPRSKMSIKLFQKTWGLPEDGFLNAKAQRTLMFVAADRVWV